MIFEKKILSIYKSKLLKRRDPDGRSHIFSREEFEGLMCEELSFIGDRGQTLCAYLYYRGEPRRDTLVMLDHGMGCGHNSYLGEIDVITRRGYTVFTYDHTGTMRSGGEDIGGFSQSLCDLDRAVRFVRSLPEYKGARLSVIGHSWGGFSAMNIAALHPEISHAVALSGFISPKAIQDQVCRGLLKLYRPMLYSLERERLPEYADFDGRMSLSNSNVKTLLVHSRDDQICLFDLHFMKLHEALCDHPYVTLLPLDGKGHYPQYTAEAVKYKRAWDAEVKQLTKKGLLQTDAQRAQLIARHDFHKMHEQDMELWAVIFHFLES